LQFRWKGKERPLVLQYPPYGSLLLAFDGDNPPERVPVDFTPSTPKSIPATKTT
jgi:hypothetical protein